MLTVKRMSRKDQSAKYGTWFGEDASTDKLMRRVEEQLRSCDEWKASLLELQEELRAEARKEHESELKELLKGISPEERQRLLEGL